jgi:hypothetical protein
VSSAVPPWPGEDHVCDTCGLDFAAMAVPAVADGLVDVGAAIAAVADRSGSDAAWREPPADGSWSAIEYVCHVRDVFVAGTIRLHRIRTEDDPVLEPMLNDLRARRFDYRLRELRPVLDEIRAAADGVRAEVARTADWDRTGARRVGDTVERRTARWMLRQVVHETVHHHRDIAVRVR